MVPMIIFETSKFLKVLMIIFETSKFLKVHVLHIVYDRVIGALQIKFLATVES